MNKWIAEFELEDGDTMPEHMDLEYKGAKIDFHCRPMWIPCSERLPETDMCRTLTTICTPYKGTNVRSGCFYRGLFLNDNGDTWNATDEEVLAWMPLPEPYKDGSNENN